MRNCLSYDPFFFFWPEKKLLLPERNNTNPNTRNSKVKTIPTKYTCKTQPLPDGSKPAFTKILKLIVVNFFKKMKIFFVNLG